MMPRNTCGGELNSTGICRPRRHNMMMLHLKRAIHGLPVPKMAFVHAARAVEIGPDTADLYHAVAALYAMAGSARSNADSASYRIRGKSGRAWYSRKRIYRRHPLLCNSEGSGFPACPENTGIDTNATKGGVTAGSARQELTPFHRGCCPLAHLIQTGRAAADSQTAGRQPVANSWHARCFLLPKDNTPNPSVLFGHCQAIRYGNSHLCAAKFAVFSTVLSKRCPVGIVYRN